MVFSHPRTSKERGLLSHGKKSHISKHVYVSIRDWSVKQINMRAFDLNTSIVYDVKVSFTQ